MGVFDQIDKAPLPGSGNYFNEGVYLVDVEAAKVGDSSRNKGPFVAIEVSVIEVFVAFPAGRPSWIDGKPLPASNKPGERVSNVVMLQKESAASNIKGFLVAATGLPAEKVDKGVAEKCFAGDGQTLKGVRLLCRASLIKTREGKPFTKILWEAPSSDVIAKLRAATGTGASPPA